MLTSVNPFRITAVSASNTTRSTKYKVYFAQTFASESDLYFSIKDDNGTLIWVRYNTCQIVDE